MSELAAKIRQLRMQQQLGLRELAGRLGKSPGYLSRIEGRGEIPSPTFLWRLAEVLDADAEELLSLRHQETLRRAQAMIHQRHEQTLSLFRKTK